MLSAGTQAFCLPDIPAGGQARGRRSAPTRRQREDGSMFADSLETLRKRRSAKWRTYPADVLPLGVAEMDCSLAAPITAALRAAVDAADTGYSAAQPELGAAAAGFAARRWGWQLDPGSVTAVADVGVGVVELLRGLTRPADAVVISPPVYPPFFQWPREAGAQLREVPLTAEFRL